MTRTLTESEMLQLWKRTCAVEPLRLDCTALRTDGPDVDALLIDRMRRWYLDLLDHGPESAVAVSNASQVATVQTLSDGRALIKGPDGCRRILSVMFSDWDFPVKVRELPERQGPRNPYLRRPEAYRIDGARIAVCGARGTLSELRCVVDISNKVYIFDDSAIDSIKSYDQTS